MHKDVGGLITDPLSSKFERRDDQPLMPDSAVSRVVMDDGLLPGCIFPKIYMFVMVQMVFL